MNKGMSVFELEKNVDELKISYRTAVNELDFLINTMAPKKVKAINYNCEPGSKMEKTELDSILAIQEKRIEIEARRKIYTKQRALLREYKKKYGESDYFTELEKKVIELRHNQGLSLLSISQRLGYDYNYIMNVSSKIKKKAKYIN